MSYVAIVKTAADEPLWPGLPPEYPVLCAEYSTPEEARNAHPGIPDARLMTLAEYRAFSKAMHDANPDPRKKERMALALVHSQPSLPAKARWWQFWRWI